jgi:hypothetical protein
MTLSSAGKMVGVDVKSNGSTFEAGTATELFETGYINILSGHPYNTFAVSADGQRFLIPRFPAMATAMTSAPIVVVLNWAASLAK